MSIKYHYTRLNGNNEFVKRENLMKAQAIRLYCLECMAFQQSEVRECPNIVCPLHPFRFGKEEKPLDRKEYYKHIKKLSGNVVKLEKREISEEHKKRLQEARQKAREG